MSFRSKRVAYVTRILFYDAHLRVLDDLSSGRISFCGGLSLCFKIRFVFF
jgi:hypothetical protein